MSVDDPTDRPRSGSLLPFLPTGWGGGWYQCPVPDCRYKERASSDGLLAEEICPDHGAVLRPMKSGAPQDGVRRGQAH
jgi:hypothetical protein